MDKKIKIAHIIYGLKYGGAERLLIPLSTRFDKAKFNVMVIALTWGGPVEEELRKEAIDVRVLRRDGKFGLLDLLELIQLIREEEIDIVHTHLQNADFWGGCAAKFCRIKHISTFHGSYFKATPSEFLKQRLRVIFPDKIIAVSKSTAEHCIARLKAKKDKVLVIYNGVDIEKFQVAQEASSAKSKIGIPENATALGTFGRLEIEKGHCYLIEAVSFLKRRYPNIKLAALIVGEGSLKQELLKIAIRLEVKDEVKFLGGRDDISRLLKITDIVVIPSLSEGLSISCLEAMAAGKPVVATDVGGTPELIENEKDGLLVKPKDISALAQAILRLIEDRTLVYQLAYKAKEKVEKYFSEKQMLAGISAIYEEILSPRHN